VSELLVRAIFVFHVDIIHFLCKSVVFEGDLLLEKVEFFLSIDGFYSLKHPKKYFLSTK